mmetsp:Transcript_46520/g.106060  ORF Transcript_46520/g.106060 Transcript_46520/m.106060 type:complete len:425 (-) Transcript_46520:823-2097(-)
MLRSRLMRAMSVLSWFSLAFPPLSPAIEYSNAVVAARAISFSSTRRAASVLASTIAACAAACACAAAASVAARAASAVANASASVFARSASSSASIRRRSAAANSASIFATSAAASASIFTSCAANFASASSDSMRDCSIWADCSACRSSSASFAWRRSSSAFAFSKSSSSFALSNPSSFFFSSWSLFASSAAARASAAAASAAAWISAAATDAFSSAAANCFARSAACSARSLSSSLSSCDSSSDNPLLTAAPLSPENASTAGAPLASGDPGLSIPEAGPSVPRLVFFSEAGLSATGADFPQEKSEEKKPGWSSLAGAGAVSCSVACCARTRAACTVALWACERSDATPSSSTFPSATCPRWSASPIASSTTTAGLSARRTRFEKSRGSPRTGTFHSWLMPKSRCQSPDAESMSTDFSSHWSM